MKAEGLLLQAGSVSAGYEARRVLCEVSFAVSADDFIILRGPNGGGKTTLLSLMAGLLAVGEGCMERQSRLRIGYLPQQRHIDRRFPITVGEVVRSGLMAAKPWWRHTSRTLTEQADNAMRQLDIAHLSKRPISDLSGGQWQRTLLARALASQPHLLLLDEPDTHLDAATKALLYDILAREATRRAVVVVSHDEELPRRVSSHQLWRVEGGRIHVQ